MEVKAEIMLEKEKPKFINFIDPEKSKKVAITVEIKSNKISHRGGYTLYENDFKSIFLRILEYVGVGIIDEIDLEFKNSKKNNRNYSLINSFTENQTNYHASI